MGFRFNKTLKQNVDPLTELLEDNPSFKYSFKNEDISMKSAFKENDTAKIGIAIKRWKGLSLLAAPICTYLAFIIYTYSDPIQLAKEKNKEKENLNIEKKILESA